MKKIISGLALLLITTATVNAQTAPKSNANTGTNAEVVKPVQQPSTPVTTAVPPESPTPDQAPTKRVKHAKADSTKAKISKGRVR